MHRSASWTRGPSDEYSMHLTPTMASSSLRGADQNSELPMYDPIVEMAKKEKSRRFAEKAVHVIPVVLLVCGFILWFFCNPDVEAGLKRDTLVIGGKVEGLTIEGDIDNDSDGTQTGFLPIDAANAKKPVAVRHRKLYETGNTKLEY